MGPGVYGPWPSHPGHEVVIRTLEKPWWGLGLIAYEREHVLTPPPGTPYDDVARVRDEALGFESTISAAIRVVGS